MPNGQQDKDMTGALFRNKNKTPGDNRPDYRGPARLFGRQCEMAAWLRTSQNGERYMSFKFEAKDEQPQQQGQGAAPAPAPAPDPDDIPF